MFPLLCTQTQGRCSPYAEYSECVGQGGPVKPHPPPPPPPPPPPRRQPDSEELNCVGGGAHSRTTKLRAPKGSAAGLHKPVKGCPATDYIYHQRGRHHTGVVKRLWFKTPSHFHVKKIPEKSGCVRTDYLLNFSMILGRNRVDVADYLTAQG